MNTLKEALDKLEEAKEMLSKAIQNSLQTKSILSGKCAIQVNNEREFNLMMQYLESQKCYWISDDPILTYAPTVNFPYRIIVDNKVITWSSNSEVDTFKFEDFAKEVGIKVPVFIMKSVDGVDLYEGDDYHEAHIDSGPYSTWYYLHGDHFSVCKEIRPVSIPNKSKAFSTKEAAEAWIEEKNLVRTVDTDKLGEIEIYRNGIGKNGIIQITDRQLEQIWNAYQSLK